MYPWGDLLTNYNGTAITYDASERLTGVSTYANVIRNANVWFVLA